MRTLLLAVSLLLAPGLQAQDSSAAQPQPESAPVPAPATASSLLQPSLDQLRQSLSGLRLDKWKAPGPLREETNGNIGSITRDLDGTLPGLLMTADAAPRVVSKNLPVFRNVDALYDVLLRIVQTADLAAPDGEKQTLHAALSSLDSARRTLGDAIETAAVDSEQQLGQAQHRAAMQAALPPTTNVVTDTGKSVPVHRKKPAPTKPAPQQ